MGKDWYSEYVAQPKDIAWNAERGHTEESAKHEVVVFREPA